MFAGLPCGRSTDQKAVRVRSLRTQQCTDSQCHLLGAGLCLLLLWWWVGLVLGLFFLVQIFELAFARVWTSDLCRIFVWHSSSLLIGRPWFVGRVVIWHSMESLILAQDERWRRA